MGNTQHNYTKTKGLIVSLSINNTLSIMIVSIGLIASLNKNSPQHNNTKHCSINDVTQDGEHSA
jgi:hypothetical protein